MRWKFAARSIVRPVACVSLALLVAASLTVPAAMAADDWETKPYIVNDGKVDYGTYNGFRRYHSYCHVCHGPDGLGSSYAPALKSSLETLSYEEFLDVVVNGRQVVNTARESVMPGFGEVPDVMLYIDHIYAYLKARADNVVGRGRPDRLPPDEDPVFKEWKANQ